MLRVNVPTMYLKIHESGNQRIVAACDEDLMGRELADGKRYLDLDKHRSFYLGDKVDAAGLKKALGSFTSANLVGKNTVKVAMEMGLASADELMYINTVPYIQIYRI
jgi:hypothetical protein